MRLVLCLIILIQLLPFSQARSAMYSFVDENGTMHFTNVPADPRFRKVTGYDAVRRATVPGRYDEHIRTAAERYGLDPELIKAIIKVESSYNPFAVSEKGAMGLMQLMPETAREMNVAAPFEARENIMGGSRYLRKLLDLFQGDLQLCLAAYNAGPRRVQENGAIPRIPETEQYIEKVLQEYGRTGINGMARQ